MRWGPSPVTSRVQAVTQSDLRVDLYGGDSPTHASGNTKLSYIAWEPSTGTLQGITFEARRAQGVGHGQWHSRNRSPTITLSKTICCDFHFRQNGQNICSHEPVNH